MARNRGSYFYIQDNLDFKSLLIKYSRLQYYRLCLHYQIVIHSEVRHPQHHCNQDHSNSERNRQGKMDIVKDPLARTLDDSNGPQAREILHKLVHHESASKRTAHLLDQYPWYRRTSHRWWNWPKIPFLSCSQSLATWIAMETSCTKKATFWS